MSETTDRRIRSNQALLGVVIALLALAVGAWVYLLLKMGAVDESRKPGAPGPQPIVQTAHRDEPLMVMLTHPSDGMLATGTAAVMRQPDTQSQAGETIKALFADQRASQAAVLREVKLRALYVDASGNAYVDLAPLQQKDVKASAWEEHLAIYAVVNTLMQNFEEIKQVRFLLDGREAQTLAGHMDLSRKFTKRMDLVKQ